MSTQSSTGAGGNSDPQEIARFEATAQRWWDPAGEFRPLHDMNALRVGYIDERASLAGKRVLDVGCGGGLLSEAMARLRADVTGIDMGRTAIQVAELHALESQLSIRYLKESAEQHALQNAAAYDVITCLEMLEHVPDPLSVLRSICAMLRPGGHAFFSTINRNVKSYLLAVIGAEYVLNLLPRGTHTYARFIRPSELSRWARSTGLEQQSISGMQYNPITRAFRLSSSVDVNYIMYFSRPRNNQ